MGRFHNEPELPQKIREGLESQASRGWFLGRAELHGVVGGPSGFSGRWSCLWVPWGEAPSMGQSSPAPTPGQSCVLGGTAPLQGCPAVVMLLPRVDLIMPLFQQSPPCRKARRESSSPDPPGSLLWPRCLAGTGNERRGIFVSSCSQSSPKAPGFIRSVGSTEGKNSLNCQTANGSNSWECLLE